MRNAGTRGRGGIRRVNQGKMVIFFLDGGGWGGGIHRVNLGKMVIFWGASGEGGTSRKTVACRGVGAYSV